MITKSKLVLLFYVLLNLLNFCLSNPPKVCVIGNVTQPYNSQRDPRSLMGTYTLYTENTTNLNETIIDLSEPIYEHLHYGDQSSSPIQYLFKLKQIDGWTISETLPIVDEEESVYLTCFQDNLFDCTAYEWYWGYNLYDYPITSLKVLGGECNR